MKAIAADEFCNLKFLSEIKFSPEGTNACFVVSEADKEKNEYRSYLYSVKNGEFRKLTSGGKERTFFYLDEDTVLFPGNREEKKEGAPADQRSRFYRIRLSGGEAELAYSFPIPVSRVLPLTEGNLLLVGRTLPGFEELYTGSKKELARWKKHAAENADFEEIRQVPWWWNGGTYTKGAYSSLFLFDGKTKKLRRLTKTGEHVEDVEVSKDRKTVYYLSSEVQVLRHVTGVSALSKISVESGEVTLLARSTEDFEINGFMPCESFLLLIASDEKYGLNTDSDFYKMDYETAEITPYVKYGESIGSSVGADIRYGGGNILRTVRDTVYFISTRFDSAGIYKLEDGVISPVLLKEGSVDSFDICGDKILAAALFDMKAQELYDGEGRQISSFNEQALKGKYVAVPEILNFERGGHEVHGFVLKPKDYDPARKYPVIFDIHGGPKTVYGPVFVHEMQYWAGKGYFVIFCNPIGSDGRGEFMDIRGGYGMEDYEDLMAFCDKALEAYPAMDPDNLFETGGSYGGFMTNWIIGHTDRFKACVSQRSISNWFSFYGVADIGVVFTTDQNAADPWENPEKLWFHSPLRYADRVKTPTLFIHSMEDYRCPIDQGYQMFTALAAHGVETKMVCFRGENHELSRSGKPLHRLKRLNEITAWFDERKSDPS